MIHDIQENRSNETLQIVIVYTPGFLLAHGSTALTALSVGGGADAGNIHFLSHRENLAKQ